MNASKYAATLPSQPERSTARGDRRRLTFAEASELLAGWSPDGAPAEEAQRYVTGSIGRMIASSQELTRLPQGARVLEIGSSPYFFTLLMRRLRPDLDWKTTNWHPDGCVDGTAHEEQIRNSQTGKTETFHWYASNVELAALPFERESFDAAVFCEVLEHLYIDPARSLENLHDVLKPGGTLLLTTPNPSRSYNIQRVLTRKSMYDPISGYGLHGRHNREYSASELADMLDGVGFDVDKSVTIEAANQRLYRRALARFGFGEHHLVIATRRPGKARRYRPRWLYMSYPEDFYREDQESRT